MATKNRVRALQAAGIKLAEQRKAEAKPQEKPEVKADDNLPEDPRPPAPST